VNRLSRAQEWLGRAEDVLLALLLGALIVGSCAQIALRNLFDAGPAWLGPLLRYLVLFVIDLKTRRIEITGIVRDSAHTPIPLAVILSNANTKVASDDSGRFSLRATLGAKLQLSATSSGDGTDPWIATSSG